MATNEHDGGENTELARAESSSQASSSALSSAPGMDLKPTLVAHSPPDMSTNHKDTSEHHDVAVDPYEPPSEPDSQVTVDNYLDRQAEYDKYLQNSAANLNDLDGDILLAHGEDIQHVTQDVASYHLKRKRDEEEEEKVDKGEEQEVGEEKKMEGNPKKRVKVGGLEGRNAEEFLNND